MERIPILEKEIAIKDAKIKELEGRLNKNSQNSHSAPSKDPIKIKAAKPRKEGGKRGGQYGHEGSTLRKADQVDKIEYHEPKENCDCGYNLSKVVNEIYDTRQEFDIEIKHIITEHQRLAKKCPCCQKIMKGSYPEHIVAETQYGPNVKAFSLLGNIDYKLPFEKLSELINTISGLSISKGTLRNIIKTGAKNLDTFVVEIKDKLANAPLLHADETGIIVDVKLNWMHVLSNDQYTLLKVHPKRGEEAFDDILKNYHGNLVHDFFKSYFKLTNCTHIPCGSHITRELDARIEDKSNWAQQFKTLYYQLLNEQPSINLSKIDKIKKSYKSIIASAKKEEPEPIRNGSRGRLKHSIGLNLALRLEQYIEEIIAFAFDDSIPFTNNQAERDLRSSKIKLKVSGCFRSFQGAQDYATIMSAISTLKKQSYDVFGSFVNLFRYNGITLTPE